MDFTSFLQLAISGLVGYWVRSLFDTRDLRRAMLKEPFEAFEKTAHDIRHTWRSIQRNHIENGDYSSYAKHYNNSIKDLDSYYIAICYTCDKIRETKLKCLITNAYKDIINAIKLYDTFITNRDSKKGDFSTDAKDARLELAESLKLSSSIFDQKYDSLFLPVYKRYWILISTTCPWLYGLR